MKSRRYSPTEYPVSKQPFNRRSSWNLSACNWTQCLPLSHTRRLQLGNHFAHNHVEKAHGVPPTFEPIQVQRPFMSPSFSPSVILPDGTTPVALDPGALDVIRPRLRSSPPAQHALAALCSSWVPGRVAFVHASPMPHVHRTLR